MATNVFFSTNESFVYCWTDTVTNKLYVGVHKGSIDDGYIASSKQFLKEYNKRPNDFIRQIIANGLDSDMRLLESKILEADDARKNPIYYNLHNNNGKFYWKGKRGPQSKEHIEKSAIARIGKTQSAETIAKRVAKNTGKKRTAETCEKISLSNKGKIISLEQKKILSEKRKARKDKSELGAMAGKESANKRKNSGFYQSAEWKEIHKRSIETRKRNKLCHQ